MLNEATQERRELQTPLSDGQIAYGATVISGLHRALEAAVTPPYQKPEHAVEGWGLVRTNLDRRGSFADIPTVHILGFRALYLSPQVGVITRVLEGVHPRDLSTVTVDTSSTSAEAILIEDPSILDALPGVVAEYQEAYSLEYQIPAE